VLALRNGRIKRFRWFQTIEEAYAAAHELD
jgi:hypothetical protein